LEYWGFSNICRLSDGSTVGGEIFIAAIINLSQQILCFVIASKMKQSLSFYCCSNWSLLPGYKPLTSPLPSWGEGLFVYIIKMPQQV
jgi:hypothetical protein